MLEVVAREDRVDARAVDARHVGHRPDDVRLHRFVDVEPDFGPGAVVESSRGAIDPVVAAADVKQLLQADRSAANPYARFVRPAAIPAADWKKRRRDV